MSQVSRFIDQLSGMVRVAHSNLYFDLGSANSRVSYQGKVVYAQPSCATYHEETNSVLQLGQSALNSVNRTPGTLSTIFPIRQGYITDLSRVRSYISAVINQALSSAQQKVVITMSGVYAIPSRLSPVEKQMLERVLKQAGLSSVTLVPKPVAVVAALRHKQPLGPYVCVMDIGSQTTELGLFVGNDCQAATTIYIGGDTLTQRIKELVRSENQALIGWQSAEKLKFQQRNANWVVDPNDEHTYAVRAKNLLNLSPTTIFLKRSSLHQTFLSVADDLLDEVTSFFALQDPETVSNALEQGLFVTGGSSQLTGLTGFLAEKLKTQINHAAKPHEDVIQGLMVM